MDAAVVVVTTELDVRPVAAEGGIPYFDRHDVDVRAARSGPVTVTVVGDVHSTDPNGRRL
ncbi:hypothetical protein [Streptomyces sp. TLI_053]|uniref:hypothetical protein n=1 Tax=Streptomyces sp. TLI_053 TaxID=1855352 RepID=UPI000B83658B|nr:hypothetical protein [Streptomyces sp. TLI_053]